MLVAAVVATPFGLGGARRRSPIRVWLLWGIGVGLCSSVIPYVTDQLAMARLPRATFALMLALLPAAATVIGLVVLGQVPTVAGPGRHRPGHRRRRPAPRPERRRENHMKYTQLGHSGLQVSQVCLGMMSFGNPPPGHPSWRAWHLTGDAARDIVHHAVDEGVTFFDTADSYSGGASEQVTGELLRSSFRPPRRLRPGYQGLLPQSRIEAALVSRSSEVITRRPLLEAA